MIIQQEHVRFRRHDPTSGIGYITIKTEGDGWDKRIVGETKVAVLTIAHRQFQLPGQEVRSGVAMDMQTWAEVILDVE